MGESGDGDRAGSLPPRSDVEEGWLDTPNCPVCLTRMEAVDSPTGEPFWRCPACGQARVA